MLWVQDGDDSKMCGLKIGWAKDNWATLTRVSLNKFGPAQKFPW